MRYCPFPAWNHEGRYLIGDLETGGLVRRRNGRVFVGNVFAAYVRSCWLEIRHAVR